MKVVIAYVWVLKMVSNYFWSKNHKFLMPEYDSSSLKISEKCAHMLLLVKKRRFYAAFKTQLFDNYQALSPPQLSCHYD